jgi:alpha-D-ribose 1-methylphosphonate 5-triphosphate synthase subunit PhnG
MTVSTGKTDGAVADALRARREVMEACADATLAELSEAVRALGGNDDVADVRPPETGLVMLRGRIGGDGAPFNVGEATVTRAVVRLATGEMGHSYLLGRSAERARAAATLDALVQTSQAAHAKIREVFVAPVRDRVARERATRQAEVAKTKVDFFTLARGDD